MRPYALAISALLWASACSSGSHGDHGGTSHEPARHHGLTDEQAHQAVATVGDTTITTGELADELSAQSPFLRARYGSRERRLEFCRTACASSCSRRRRTASTTTIPTT